MMDMLFFGAILCYFAAMLTQMIASALGKSESWARVTYYRAKQKIMEGLGR